MNVDENAYADVGGYRVALNRHYDADTHIWVSVLSSDAVRIGMDPLGVETSGTLAQLSFVPVGTLLQRGQAFGGLEAAKFVGPLITPLTGEVLSHNEAVLANPGLAEVDPFDAGWLIELRPSALDDELLQLVSGDAVGPWFTERLADYRMKGVVAQ